MARRKSVPRGIGLALSGGGFRAMLLHVGALWTPLAAGRFDGTIWRTALQF